MQYQSLILDHVHLRFRPRKSWKSIFKLKILEFYSASQIWWHLFWPEILWKLTVPPHWVETPTKRPRGKIKLQRIFGQNGCHHIWDALYENIGTIFHLFSHFGILAGFFEEKVSWFKNSKSRNSDYLYDIAYHLWNVRDQLWIF